MIKIVLFFQLTTLFSLPSGCNNELKWRSRNNERETAFGIGSKICVQIISLLSLPTPSVLSAPIPTTPLLSLGPPPTDTTASSSSPRAPRRGRAVYPVVSRQLTPQTRAAREFCVLCTLRRVCTPTDRERERKRERVAEEKRRRTMKRWRINRDNSTTPFVFEGTRFAVLLADIRSQLEESGIEEKEKEKERREPVRRSASTQQGEGEG